MDPVCTLHKGCAPPPQKNPREHHSQIHPFHGLCEWWGFFEFCSIQPIQLYRAALVLVVSFNLVTFDIEKI